MAVKMATLLQDVADLIDIFQPSLKLILSYFQQETNITQEEAMTWIIREELGMIYGLFDLSHNRNSPVHRYIYDYLSAMLPFPISTYIGQFIAAPKVYPDDNTIQVKLCGRDLFIRYFNRGRGLKLTFLRHQSP